MCIHKIRDSAAELAKKKKHQQQQQHTYPNNIELCVRVLFFSFFSFTKFSAKSNNEMKKKNAIITESSALFSMRMH